MISSSSGIESVCAVIVTYNRKELLRECLTAVLAQTHPVKRILVIDNFSTDGTADMVREGFPSETILHLELVTLPENRGGAGGFHEGIRRAAGEECEWLWLMDDDTIPQREALEELLKARGRFSKEQRPDLLASKVVWTDGGLHRMNMQWMKITNPEHSFHAAAASSMPLRTATFVSLLMRRSLVEELGLPVSDYFVWGDDTEYTGRILKEHLGVAVPASVVIHKTSKNHGSADVSPRFYYHVRNTLWLTFRSDAFNWREKLTCWSQLGKAISFYLRRARVSEYKVVARGIWDALTSRPRQ